MKSWQAVVARRNQICNQCRFCQEMWGSEYICDCIIMWLHSGYMPTYPTNINFDISGYVRISPACSAVHNNAIHCEFDFRCVFAWFFLFLRCARVLIVNWRDNIISHWIVKNSFRGITDLIFKNGHPGCYLWGRLWRLGVGTSISAINFSIQSIILNQCSNKA